MSFSNSTGEIRPVSASISPTEARVMACCLSGITSAHENLVDCCRALSADSPGVDQLKAVLGISAGSERLLALIGSSVRGLANGSEMAHQAVANGAAASVKSSGLSALIRRDVDALAAKWDVFNRSVVGMIAKNSRLSVRVGEIDALLIIDSLLTSLEVLSAQMGEYIYDLKPVRQVASETTAEAAADLRGASESLPSGDDLDAAASCSSDRKAVARDAYDQFTLRLDEARCVLGLVIRAEDNRRGSAAPVLEVCDRLLDQLLSAGLSVLKTWDHSNDPLPRDLPLFECEPGDWNSGLFNLESYIAESERMGALASVMQCVAAAKESNAVLSLAANDESGLARESASALAVCGRLLDEAAFLIPVMVSGVSVADRGVLA